MRLDERVACPKDDTIVSAPTPSAIVESGKLGDALSYPIGGAVVAGPTDPWFDGDRS